MKTKNTPLFIARLALTLFVICAVVAILLALVNRVTAPRIETINAEKATKALSAVLSDADQATKLDTFQDDTGMVQAVYVSPSGYAIEVTPTGFGGTIDMMVGISKDGTWAPWRPPATARARPSGNSSLVFPVPWPSARTAAVWMPSPVPPLPPGP